MSASNRLAAAAVVFLALAGCQSAPMRAVKDGLQEVKSGWRSKGEKQTGSSAAVRRELGCDSRRFELRLEHSEVLPQRVRIGRELNHRFVYAACTPHDAVEAYPMVRRVLHRGRVLFEDRDREFEIRAGRWAVDAFVGIPPAATPGSYVLELEIELRKGAIRKMRNEFEVLPAQPAN
jgi:hypothetical protein